VKTYAVTIKATVYKTLIVDAENEDEAYIAAHEDFSVLPDGKDERYEQETIDIEEWELKA
jgi:hypothetical protein